MKNISNCDTLIRFAEFKGDLKPVYDYNHLFHLSR